MNIYFDMNIYYRCFDDQTEPKIELESKAIEIIFKLMERWQYKVFWSYILEFENSNNPSIDKRKHIKTIVEYFCSETILWNEEIDKIAKEIVEKSHARSKDALHLACSIYKRCEYFLTCDNRFVKTIKHNEKNLTHLLGSIKILNPVDFIGKEFGYNASK